MDKIKVEIANGYGIKKFDHTFEFDQTARYPHNDTHIVYAQNGTMKSSFAKVLNDYAMGFSIRDHIFDIDGSCKITNASGDEISKGSVFSVASFDNGEFESQSTGTLLVSNDLKSEYQNLIKKYDDALDVLLKTIKKVSRINARSTEQDIISEIVKQYGDAIPDTPQGLITLIKSIRSEVESAADYIHQMPYSVIGSKDALKFADDNKGIIQDLMNAYDEVRKSASFVRGEFDSGNARKLVDAVSKTKFLEVEHELELLNAQTGKRQTITTLEELEATLETDIDRILAKNPTLKKKFEKMIKDLSTDSRSGLKSILEGADTRDVILLMNNPRIYLRKLWEGYLKHCLEEFDELCAVQSEIEAPLLEIIEKAKIEKTEWDKVVKKFNDKFRNLPYEIGIVNRESVILKGVEEPEPEIIYKGVSRNKSFKTADERKGVKKLLSTGERKALYLLNVMFEVEANEKQGKPYLVVLDDIVDSFDYKNKYAFLEYIYDISKNYNHIKLIIFTHNYDFFRLLQSRLFGNSYRKRSWFATKSTSETALVQAEHFRVFGYMRQNAQTDKKMWLAMIPFARNLCEYRCDDITTDQNYLLLTNCLHSLDTDITIGEIKKVLKHEIGIDDAPFDDDEKFENALLDQALEVQASPPSGINLYDGLILSMASRRLAENYMKSKMSQADIDQVKSDENTFTRKLFEKYSLDYSEQQDILDNLDLVNLITPEHIHVNSFMYEPLIDVSNEELLQLHANLSVI